MTASPEPDGYRVLVVDDEHVIADTLAIILRQAGYDAATAYNGREALEAARRFHPDMLVSDIVMPDMDGIELATIFAHEAPSCRVLLISGHASYKHMMDEASRNGHSFPLISKPIHPEDLLRRIAQYRAG